MDGLRNLTSLTCCCLTDSVIFTALQSRQDPLLLQSQHRLPDKLIYFDINHRLTTQFQIPSEVICPRTYQHLASLIYNLFLMFKFSSIYGEFRMKKPARNLKRAHRLTASDYASLHFYSLVLFISPFSQPQNPRTAATGQL